MGPLGPFLDDEITPRTPTPTQTDQEVEDFDCEDEPKDLSQQQYKKYKEYCQIVEPTTEIQVKETAHQDEADGECETQQTTDDYIIAMFAELHRACTRDPSQCSGKYMEVMELLLTEGDKAHDLQDFEEALMFYAHVIFFTDKHSDLFDQAFTSVAKIDVKLAEQAVKESQFVYAANAYSEVLSINSLVSMPEIAYPACIELIFLCSQFYETTVNLIISEQNPTNLAKLMVDADKNFKYFKYLIRLAKKMKPDHYLEALETVQYSLDILYKETSSSLTLGTPNESEVKHVLAQMRKLLRKLTP